MGSCPSNLSNPPVHVPDDDCLFVIHLKFTFSDNIKAVVSQVPVFRSRAVLQLRKAAFTRHAATRRLHSFQ